MKIYLDMDGVLANMKLGVFHALQRSFEELAPTSPGRWAIISELAPDLYVSLPAMRDANLLVDTVTLLCEQHRAGLGVLTALPKYGNLPNCALHKVIWLGNHWPHLVDGFNIGPLSEDKWKHAAPGDVLIDDSPMNIDQWNAAGGYGILHTTATDTLQKLTEYFTQQ